MKAALSRDGYRGHWHERQSRGVAHVVQVCHADSARGDWLNDCHFEVCTFAPLHRLMHSSATSATVSFVAMEPVAAPWPVAGTHEWQPGGTLLVRGGRCRRQELRLRRPVASTRASSWRMVWRCRRQVIDLRLVPEQRLWLPTRATAPVVRTARTSCTVALRRAGWLHPCAR